MQLLYIGYWGGKDALSISTIHPHLNILADFDNITKIIYISIERSNFETISFTNPKIKHFPLASFKTKVNVLNKILDVIFLQKKIDKIVSLNNFSKIIARSSMAGIFAYKAALKFKIPFYVESFEPHAQYMLNAKVWRKHSLKSIFQKRWEKIQLQNATALMPVSNNYKALLVSQGKNESLVDVIPCCVNQKLFEFNEIARKKVRANLKIEDAVTVGIYVGKFGGLYYKEKAYEIFKQSFAFFKQNFYLIIVSLDNPNNIITQLKKHEIDISKVFVGKLEHAKIPEYLSAADFSFVLCKPTPSSMYSSSIKTGEYWASGLPILSPKNIGDDSNIIELENAGALFDLNENSIANALNKISLIIFNKSYRNNIMQLANKYRSFNICKNVYLKYYN